jgi:dTDP-glucose 4,6-dehydratase
MNILVTGGLGFIGGHFLTKMADKNPVDQIIVFDKMTYASNYNRLKHVFEKSNFFLVRGDIANKNDVQHVFQTHKPNILINFAAESHVDSSINNPNLFLDVNTQGTLNLLIEAKKLWVDENNMLKKPFQKSIFYQISTDEVFGSLSNINSFDEKSPYSPNSPYSASKASADHFVKAFHNTYNLPTIISYSSNNFGPYQNDEKLIPKIISCVKKNIDIPIYSDGSNIRDWIYVEDHCNAINLVLEKGKPGKEYCIGGSNEMSNLEICKLILENIDILIPDKNKKKYMDKIKFVKDRKGHDFRYSLKTSKIFHDHGIFQDSSFKENLKFTISHFLNLKK